jgi:transposase
VILSSRGYTVRAIAEIYELDRDTVSAWLTSFEEFGMEGLDDEPRIGRPRKIGPDKEEIVKRVVHESPQDPHKAFEAECPDNKASKDTFRRVLDGLGYVWKRFRLTLKDKRDEIEFRRCQEVLEEFLGNARKGEIDIYFLDEAGFSLKPSIPYGWQLRGETNPIITGPNHTQRINALGLLHHSGAKLYSCLVEGSIDGDVLADSLDEICRTMPKDKPIVIFLDNASIHHSDEVTEVIDSLEEAYNIRFFYLPAYSPELNRIEILWKQIKHFWLGIDCYRTIEDLSARLFEIFANFGIKYRITFA